MTGYLLPTISTVRQYQTHVHSSSSTPGRSRGRSITITAEAEATAPSTSQPSSPWPSAEDAPCVATLLEGPVGVFLGTSLPWTHRLHAHCHMGSGFVLKSSFPAVPTACSHKFPSVFSLGFLSFSMLPRMLIPHMSRQRTAHGKAIPSLLFLHSAWRSLLPQPCNTKTSLLLTPLKCETCI